MTYQPPQYPPAQPVQGVPGQVQWGAPPPAPKKKRWPWIVAGVLLAGVLGCVGLFTLVLGGTAKVVGDAAGEMDANRKGENAVAGKVGTAATDGKFQFTVTKLKCGVDRVGPAEFGEKAQGEFCLLDVTVKNVGASAEVFSDMSQYAYDAAGGEYQVDSGAGTWANKDHSTFLESLNPGNTVKGKLVFDVPEGTKLTSVVLHESMYTAGIRVPLAG
ncbi:hypothetical protein FB565_008419 [Actinoplanes lutulentus]|uniref:Uncharacterized protein DUF4352 n=1 Tax=Actinoplanes lutulentus TaxID=1287878 RepID=A0A327Z5E2_9ACTN|nr:DUF4352 domain-containing protein [Actinoplanes lutulentus]MBB2948636.1 hypothetical protein [Actinoplanes lutulentus]RAK27993.1 uncharacterized protein DUF4352 [Actinoplanes lutulentus]